MINISFRKIVTYLLVRSRYNTAEFDKSVGVYLRNINVPINVFSTIEREFKTAPPLKTPRSLLKPKYKERMFLKWLEVTDYSRIHDMLSEDKFMTLVYDTDVRFKIEMLAMAGFPQKEIINIFGVMEPEIIKTYLDFFADFSSYQTPDFERHTVYYAVDDMQCEYSRIVLENQHKKDFVRSLLLLPMKHLDTVKQVEFMKNICYFDFVGAIASHDESKKEKALNQFTRMLSSARDIMNTETNQESLQDLLKKNDEEIDSPKIYTMEELNALQEETTDNS